MVQSNFHCSYPQQHELIWFDNENEIEVVIAYNCNNKGKLFRIQASKSQKWTW